MTFFFASLSIFACLVRLCDAASDAAIQATEPHAMQYLLLIYSAESDDANQDPAQIMADYGAFTLGIVQSGAFKSADRLRPVADATTVRVRGGKTMTTDGPFAETREQLGGYYLVEAKDLDEAVGIAAKVPTARHGSIEVRPVWSMGG